jgi:hypothetical protein
MAASAVYSTGEILQSTAKYTRKDYNLLPQIRFRFSDITLIISNVDIKHRAETKLFCTCGKVLTDSPSTGFKNDVFNNFIYAALIYLQCSEYRL